jgi:hypothetical protein
MLNEAERLFKLFPEGPGKSFLYLDPIINKINYYIVLDINK